jgi:predicted deacylase
MHDVGGRHIRELNLLDTEPGTIGHYWMHIVNNAIGEPIRIPLMVARGRTDGPVLGVTAAIHGNELNGIPVIQRMFAELPIDELRGTVVGALVLNVPGLIREQRVFNDGQDLNRIAPGRPDGTTSQVYVHRIIQRLIRHFDVFVDLHTASFGRVNSHYVRANMGDADTARLAQLMNPEIIVNDDPNETNLRGAASELGIRSVTVELRDPHVFQNAVVADGLIGLRNAMVDLGMIGGEITPPSETITLCERSYWMYTDEGGILWVYPEVAAGVRAGELVAEVRTIFGEATARYHAPEAAIVVGRSVNPLNQTGSRIVHLGVGPTSLARLDS